MANLLGLQAVCVTVGTRALLDGVTVGVQDGDRIGVLGPNGAGKSTLLAVLSGERSVDGGSVTRSGGLRIAALTQTDDYTNTATVLQTVHGNTPEHVWAGDATIRSIHAGLLAGIALDAPLATLSGGQRRRVALAAALSAPADLLILDEPTNHLDVEAVAWLAKHLNARFAARNARGALVTVTHDRWFLDAVCSHIWEVVPGVDPGNAPQIPGRVQTYDGGYAAYVLTRAQRARQAELAAEKRENLLRKELAWLRRGAPARTSKPRFRINAAEALIANVPPPRDKVELLAMASARLGKKVIDLEDVTVRYPVPGKANAYQEVLKSVTWRLAPGERVGIVGVNGAGKTTLLRLLAGSQTPTAGRVVRGKTVQVATLSQSTHELDDLAQLRVVEAVMLVGEHVTVAGKELSAMQLVERLGFTRQRAWTRVGEISGGERRRLQLLRLLMGQPNVLLLDEPTNDLDTDTLTAMEDLLDSFPGTLVVVSHDRYLLERVTDRQMALLGDGRIRDLPGGVDQYLQLREQEQAKAAPVPSSLSPSAAAKPALSGAKLHQLQRDLARIERSLAKQSQQVAQLQQRLAVACSDPSRVAEVSTLGRELANAQAAQAELEGQWLSAAEALE